MITVGVDIGSVATKAVVLENNTLLARDLVPSGSRPKFSAQAVVERALRAAGVEQANVSRIVSTGYGRRVMEFGDRTITEISACAIGTVFLGCPAGPVGTIIDLGGQDIKVIGLDSGGLVRDFIMNDKCAAGTGRFLEVLAHALDVRVEDLGPLSARAQKPAQISATCTVFAESEIISLLAQDVEKENIVAGIHESIAARIYAMAEKVGLLEPFVFNGGGACNAGLKTALEAKLNTTLYIPEYPQFVNALGAALEARE